RSVQHDLQGEQHDQRVPSEEDAERPRAEEEGRDTQIPGDAWADHNGGTWSIARRECAPRMTPPIAATSRTIDVISNASRWSVRNSRPIHPGVPNVRCTCSLWLSRPPALRASATMISRKSAPAARVAPTDCQLGPPAHGASMRGQTYALT